MAAMGVSGAVVAVSPKHSSGLMVFSGEKCHGTSGLPSMSHFFSQRYGMGSLRGEVGRRRRDSAMSGTWAYATDADYFGEDFTSSTGYLGNNIKCKNLYDCLGLSRFATQEQIKAAYRSKALKVHPDVVSENKREEASKEFQELNRAYEILSNRHERAAYDLKLRFQERSPVSIPTSQWGFISVPSNPDDPNGSIKFRGRKYYESDFFFVGSSAGEIRFYICGGRI